MEYAGASKGIMPRLLAASPTKVLTRAALTMPPISVFSDLAATQTKSFITSTHVHFE